MTKALANSSAGILLIDDGELDEVARVLETQGISYVRLRGGQIPPKVAPPRDLLIVTPRRVERVRRGSPVDAGAGRPLRVIAVQEDSPAMRRRLRRSGLHLLVRLPTQAEIWRLLIARALYRGNERREDPRVAVGSPVSVVADGSAETQAGSTTILVDLSNRGCRLQTSAEFEVNDSVEFSIPADHDGPGGNEPLTVWGRVWRIASFRGADTRMLAVVFDAEMPQKSRTRLTALINRWASGPHSLRPVDVIDAPAIPPCRLASIPDLVLNDETDPPVSARSEIRVQLVGSEKNDHARARSHARGHYESSVEAYIRILRVLHFLDELFAIWAGVGSRFPFLRGRPLPFFVALGSS